MDGGLKRQFIVVSENLVFPHEYKIITKLK